MPAVYAKTGTPRTRNYDLLIVTAAAILTLLIHLAWILFVIFGALWTRRRPVWSAIHILALLWGIVVEVSPWPCPLTLAENYFEAGAGTAPYRGGFLLHYLDAMVYPNLPDWLITVTGVAVCGFNLGIYLWRFRGLLRRNHER
ncbi:MAG: DUF2784 domain-containing protein [Terracidiphilus sp.]